VKKPCFSGALWGQPLWLPQGGHKGRPYNAILSHLLCFGMRSSKLDSNSALGAWDAYIHQELSILSGAAVDLR
jgi:hypothetical protein